ncbi:MAG: FtsX-like permease family protein [Candidatus Poseidoniaceae archaeon]|nr:FtsX-like permease family protein [Candidatus Poseidoniaceae archaeon]
MIAIGVFGGISLGYYANTATNIYEYAYSDTPETMNLADIWVENPSEVWNQSTSMKLCDELFSQWDNQELTLDECEARLILDGVLYHQSDSGNENMVVSVWHGIDEGGIDRVWIPEDECCAGRMAQTDNEIVLDSHAADGMGIGIGDVISIGAGHGRMNFTVVGIGFHSQHLYFTIEGELMPAQAGTFASGYLTEQGLNKLANLSSGSTNRLLLDLEGTPEYDLLSTEINEGEKMGKAMTQVATIISQDEEIKAMVYDRSGIDSVEFLRADAEGAQKSYGFITGMLAMVAGITIFLSLQRLIQSQAKEIAVMRTLGVSRRKIMPAYILAPIVIGFIGCTIGVLLGVYVGAPAMVKMYENVIGIPAIDDSIDYSLVLSNVSIAMVVILLSGIRPAWQASRLDPLKVLRGQHEVRLSSRRIQKLTAKLPASVGLTLRSSIRKPFRIAFTFIAVGMSMLIFGSMFLMMDSMEEVMVRDYDENQNWEAQVFVPFAGEAAVGEWAQENGADYEYLLQFPVNPADDARQMTAFGMDNFATQGESAMILLNLDEGELPKSGQNPPQVLIDEGTAHFLDWQVGQYQTIVIGSKEQVVEISGITTGEISRTVYFHRAELAELTGLEATSVLLQLPTGVEIDTELGEMSVGISMKEDFLDSFNALMETQKQIFDAILLLGIVIAAAVLFNTLMMNLAERDSELATLRVLGASTNSLGKMMLGEHFAIGLVGGIFGCIITIVGTKMLIAEMVQWSFFFTVQADSSVILLLIGIVVTISLLLTPIGVWRIKKMNLVDKVKEFSN